MEGRADGFFVCQNAFSDHLTHNRCDRLTRLSSPPGCLMERGNEQHIEEKRSARSSKHITEARAAAQRTKLDEQAEDRHATPETTKTRKTGWKKAQRDPLARRRTSTAVLRAIADELANHARGRSSLQRLQSV